ncbi:TlpA family protein disulfide reductase [Nonlabens ponticola]|uniref:TlpA family protein disulfide reductase n=1 Tax=Nonlabens ponticola TaxID=2496866 RepID=A0A3S9MV54_9FLAO|nr:TlpA disulfide reductase family protein [Nonlabens ponticola]AZQ43059.1 TlpA family protein disulfide reductase [Nonlabens ponticola]
MRYTVLATIIFAFLVSCDKKNHKTELIEQTEIVLELEGFDIDSDKRFIQISIENGLQPIKEQLDINAQGKVNFNFFTKRKREVLFTYEGYRFKAFVSPGESFHAIIPFDELTDYTSYYPNLKIEPSENSNLNYQIIKYGNHIDSLINTSTNGFSNDGNVNELDYANLRIREMNKQIADLKSHFNEVDNSEFISWAVSEIKNYAGNDLSLYPFVNGINEEVHADHTYFKFISKVEDDLSYLTHSKLNYLESLSTSHMIMSNVSNKYKEKREELENKGLNNFPIAYDKIKTYLNKKDGEIMMASLFMDTYRVPKSYADSLNGLVDGKLINQVHSIQESENINIINALKSFKLTDQEREPLLKIYDNADGKVIYHDFWFSTCAPCMMEMPYYNKFIESADDTVVEFVFYGVYMEEEQWQKTIEQFDLQGRHLLLNKNQLAFFEKYFDVYGYPHHHFVLSNGTIGDKTNLGPGSPKGLSELIENALTIE